jgi:hypothetical protein
LVIELDISPERQHITVRFRGAGVSPLWNLEGLTVYNFIYNAVDEKNRSPRKLIEKNGRGEWI